MPSREKMGSRSGSYVYFLALSAIAVCIGVIFTSCAPKLSVDERLADFQYLFAVLKQNHPYLAPEARVENYD